MEKVPNVQQLRYQTKGRETVPMQFANDLSRVLNEYAGKVDRLNGQELDKAREEVFTKEEWSVIANKFGLCCEERGYRVTLEYVLADDIKKEIKLLKEKE